MKNYVTYTRKQIDERFYADPNTNNWVHEQTGWQITFNETSYEIDGVFVSWIEYADTIKPAELEYFRTLDPAFNFQIVTEADINELLKTYGQDEENNYYVSVSDFIFTNNIPVDEFIV